MPFSAIIVLAGLPSNRKSQQSKKVKKLMHVWKLSRSFTTENSKLPSCLCEARDNVAAK
jgi:hypothetical protein